MPDIPVVALAPEVFQFRCLEEDEVDRVLAEARHLTGWQPAPITKKSHAQTVLREDVRRAQEILESADPTPFRSFGDLVRARVAALAHQMTWGHLTLSGLRLVRYDEGGYFKVHSDTTGTDRRRIAIVTYLNDDFSGGATIFPLLNCRATPKPGMAVVFPADRLHRGDVVTGGTKYVLVCWLLDPEVEPAENGR